MISVVIPFYSNFSWLISALESVYNQSYKEIEILVINDGSPLDDTDFIKVHGPFIKYFKTSNLGPGHARNLGIAASTGDYIAFLDSDDLWHPFKLERQLSFMVENNHVWSHTGYTLFNDHTNKPISVVNVSFFSGDVFLKSLISSPVATPCVMIKREILMGNPNLRFSEVMRYGQDGYFWLLLATTYKLGVLNDSLTQVRIRGTNAALKARVYLQVKAQIWMFLTTKKEFLEKFKLIPFIIKVSYFMSYFNFNIIKYIESKFNFKSGQIEFLSKIFYLPTYTLLKFYKKLFY
ncbi:glycosyltransferase family 2 protein [Algoriphagus sp.]|uniref:glycosyltransferase family 2 protein n=1 Tax=Algoriphagus sp. TaxID=1872435 RepID=UPI00261130B7|nr:glycosyltransferase family 2 protein [Algoriphagus sp.]